MKRRFVVGGVGMAAVIAALALYFARSPVRARKPAPRPTATPVATRPESAGKAATITGSVMPPGPAVVWLLTDKQVFQPLSDANGSFTFDDLEPGTYCVGATTPRGTGSVCGVAVAAGERRSVTLALETTQLVLTGTVRDGGGGTVAGAHIVARREPLGDRFAIATSDVAGGYRLALARGDYRLEADADGYAPQRRFVSLLADGEQSFSLMPAGAVAGVVVDAAAVPVANAEVRIRFDMFERGAFVDASRFRAVTGGDGVFELRDLPAGTFHVTARGPDPREIGEARGHITLGGRETVTIALHAGTAVRGRVVWRDTQTGVAGATVETAGPYSPVTATSDASGAFSLDGVAAGEVPIKATLAGGRSTHRFVLVASTGRDDVVLELARLGTLAGRVTARGTPIAGADVHAGPYSSTHTDESGRFSMEQPIGSVHVVAEHGGNGVSVPMVVEIGAGKTTEIELVLGGDAAIEGTVADPAGVPVPNTKVELSSGSSRLQWSVATDAAGVFRFAPLPAGNYTVEASPRGTSQAFVARGARAHVELASGETKRDIKLVALVGDHVLAGHVVDDVGAPVVGAEVWAERIAKGVAVQQGPAQATAYTAYDGSFELFGIPAGDYTLGAFHVEHDRVRARPFAAGTRDARLAFGALGSIDGTVTTPDGTPVPLFTIDMTFPDGEHFLANRHWVFANGTFHIGTLPPQQYTLVATGTAGEAGELADIEVAAGEAKRGLAITVTAPGGVRGRLVDKASKQPLAGVDVSGDNGRTVTAADGTFVLPRLRAGTQQPLWVHARDGSSRLDNTKFDLVIEPGKVTDIGDFAVTVD